MDAGVVMAFRLLLIADGALVSLEALITDSVLDAVSAVGAVGLALGAMVYFADRSPKDPAARAQT
jgi:hypothetical protein